MRLVVLGVLFVCACGTHMLAGDASSPDAAPADATTSDATAIGDAKIDAIDSSAADVGADVDDSSVADTGVDAGVSDSGSPYLPWPPPCDMCNALPQNWCGGNYDGFWCPKTCTAPPPSQTDGSSGCFVGTVDGGNAWCCPK